MKRDFWSFAALGSLGLIPFLALGCEGDEDEDDADDESTYENWFCQDNDSDCSCRALPRGRMAAGSDEVDQCGAYDCCLFTDEETDDALATCGCFSTNATCEQEAAARPGSVVTTTCPPGAQQPTVACAPQGTSCRSDYLRQNALEGCCDGTLCREDANGVPVCQSASVEDLALHDQCEHWADERFDSSEPHALSLDPLMLSTSHGLLTMGEVGFSNFYTGSGGCLREFDLQIGDFSCGLDFTAEVVGGALTITDVSGFLDGCSGFTGSLLDGNVDSAPHLVTDFAFEGLSCDGLLIYESYCLAGAFTFTLGGTVGDLTIDPQTITVEGAFCATGEASGECPTAG